MNDAPLFTLDRMWASAIGVLFIAACLPGCAKQALRSGDQDSVNLPAGATNEVRLTRDIQLKAAGVLWPNDLAPTHLICIIENSGKKPVFVETSIHLRWQRFDLVTQEVTAGGGSPFVGSPGSPREFYYLRPSKAAPEKDDKDGWRDERHIKCSSRLQSDKGTLDLGNAQLKVEATGVAYDEKTGKMVDFKLTFDVPENPIVKKSAEVSLQVGGMP